MLAVCIQDSIKQRFSTVFDSKDAIIAAVVILNLKLQWVEGQVKKDQYKQIFIDKMRKFDDEMSIVEDRNAEPDVTSQKK